MPKLYPQQLHGHPNPNVAVNEDDSQCSEQLEQVFGPPLPQSQPKRVTGESTGRSWANQGHCGSYGGPLRAPLSTTLPQLQSSR